MKLTRKQIEIVREQTREELKGKVASIKTDLGYYTPNGANWSYIVGWTYDNELVCTKFGHIM